MRVLCPVHRQDICRARDKCDTLGECLYLGMNPVCDPLCQKWRILFSFFFFFR